METTEEKRLEHLIPAVEPPEQDADPQETREWIEAFDQILDAGPDRARFILNTLVRKAQFDHLRLPELVQTPYINTIPTAEEVPYPGDESIERRLRAIIRWNAAVMVNIGTAGSITLLLQTLLPAMLFAEGPSRIEVVGGTDVIWSPPADYLRHVILEDRAKLHLRRRGFYPRGGGRIAVETDAWTPRPIGRMTRGELQKIRVYSVASAELEDRQVAERQAEAAEQRLKRHEVPIVLDAIYVQSASIGTVVTCVAEFENARLGGDALGERGKRAEEVGREAADALGAEIHSGAAVDEHAADQLVVWLALGGGSYRTSRITEHTRTNVWVTEQFLGPVVRTEENDTLRCDVPFCP